MKRINWFLLLIFFSACSKKENPVVIIKTSMGNIEAELFPKQAPKTVAAFLSLVEQKKYENGNFYRVLKDEDAGVNNNSGVIQGGVFPNKMNAPFIEHETTRQTGLRHQNGTLSFARTTVGSASTEFFICIGEQNGFNCGNMRGSDSLGFAAFGVVLKGMDVVKQIQMQKNKGEYFEKTIKIESIQLD
jgi:peptidyl-prolyl cis-trans isomerase A (cyclophilin A)